jgi:hypothetical protein
LLVSNRPLGGHGFWAVARAARRRGVERRGEKRWERGRYDMKGGS